MSEEVIIVVKADGTIAYWAQDMPALEAALQNVEALSTCDCQEDVCPEWEMEDWRTRLLSGEYDTP